MAGEGRDLSPSAASRGGRAEAPEAKRRTRARPCWHLAPASRAGAGPANLGGRGLEAGGPRNLERWTLARTEPSSFSAAARAPPVASSAQHLPSLGSS